MEYMLATDKVPVEEKKFKARNMNPAETYRIAR